jgi:hypothetical protein
MKEVSMSYEEVRDWLESRRRKMKSLSARKYGEMRPLIVTLSWQTAPVVCPSRAPWRSS